MGRMCWRACAAGAGAASSRGGAAGRASDDAPICAGLHVRRARAASHPFPCFLAPVQVVRRSSASAAAPACERCGPSGCGPSPGVPPPLTTILCSCSPCTGCGFWLALFWLALGCMWLWECPGRKWWEFTFGSSSLLPFLSSMALGAPPGQGEGARLLRCDRLKMFPPCSLTCAGHYVTDPRGANPSFLPLGQHAGLGCAPSNRRTLRLSIRMPIQTPIQMRLIKWPSPAASLPWSQGAPVEN